MSVPRQQLAEIAESVSYGVTASARDDPVGPKFLRITDIQDDSVDWASVPWCETDAHSAEGARLRSGDIVFARTGATTGKSFLIRNCPQDAVFASYLIRVRLDNATDPRYISHFFRSRDYWAQITRSARGAAQPGVNATKLKELQIPVPPLPEQKRIAAVLDAADALRAQRREALAQLDTLLQSVFLDMFGDPVLNPVRGRNARRDADPTFGGFVARMKERWRVCPLGDLFELRNGVNFAADQRGAGVPTIDVKNMYGHGAFVDTSNLYRVDVEPSDDQILQRGDILFVRSSVKREGVGWASAFRTVSEPVSFCGFIIRARPLDPAAFEPAFLIYYLRQAQLRDRLISSSGQVAITNISQANLAKLPIPRPPAALQRRFAAISNQVEELKHKHRAHLAEIDNLFASLQSRAFRGEL